MLWPPAALLFLWVSYMNIITSTTYLNLTIKYQGIFLIYFCMLIVVGLARLSHVFRSPLWFFLLYFCLSGFRCYHILYPLLFVLLLWLFHSHVSLTWRKFGWILFCMWYKYTTHIVSASFLVLFASAHNTCLWYGQSSLGWNLNYWLILPYCDLISLDELISESNNNCTMVVCWVQSHWRGWLTRKELCHSHRISAAIEIQSFVRGWITRKRLLGNFSCKFFIIFIYGMFFLFV